MMRRTESCHAAHDMTLELRDKAVPMHPGPPCPVAACFVSRAKCFTWNNLKICSKVETRSNGTTHRCVKAYKIGVIDRARPETPLKKMPLQALVFAAQPVEKDSNREGVLTT